MWLLRSEPWAGDLREFYERMCGRLARNEAAHWMYQTADKHQELVTDTRSLVEALFSMLRAVDA
jgi:hypothetical protein